MTIRTGLSRDGRLVAGVLGPGEHGSPEQVMRAIAATRSLEMIVQDTLRAPVELLADVREKVRQYGGEVQAFGTPAISVRDGYTGVDIPVALEHADGLGRVVLDLDRRVVGFFLRPAVAAPSCC